MLKKLSEIKELKEKRSELVTEVKWWRRNDKNAGALKTSQKWAGLIESHEKRIFEIDTSLRSSWG